MMNEMNEMYPDGPITYGDKRLMEMKEEMAQDLYGRSRAVALAGQQCVKCGEFNLEFRDEISRREYAISGWCQCCQNMFFDEQ